MAQLEVNSTSKGLNIGVWVSNLDIFWIIQDSKVRAIGARKHSSNKTILHEKNPRVCVDLIYISYASLDDKNVYMFDDDKAWDASSPSDSFQLTNRNLFGLKTQLKTTSFNKFHLLKASRLSQTHV